jgi:hypothetical protein
MNRGNVLLFLGCPLPCSLLLDLLFALHILFPSSSSLGIDMTVALNNLKTADGRGWYIENKKEAKSLFQKNFNQIWTDNNIFKCRFKIKFQEIESVLLQFFYYEKIEKDNVLMFCETDETIPTSIHSEDMLWMMNSTQASSLSWTNQTNNERTVEYYYSSCGYLHTLGIKDNSRPCMA